jgi:hypothetical protein
VRQRDSDAADEVHGNAEGHAEGEEAETPDRCHAACPASRHAPTSLDATKEPLGKEFFASRSPSGDVAARLPSQGSTAFGF